MKLTKAQRTALEKLSGSDDMTSSAYRLKCSTSTLWSLQKLKLVRPLGGLGSMAFPRSMSWEITAAGRSALSNAQGEQK
jgi:hypothetical protein